MIDIYESVIELLPKIDTRRYYRSKSTSYEYKKECSIVGECNQGTLFVVCYARYFKTALNKRVVELEIEVFLGDQHFKREQLMLYRAQTDDEKMDREFVNEMFKFAKKVRGKKNARK